MCNLNIIIKTKKSNVTPFLMATSSHSYAYNNDGDGLYLNSGIKKDKFLLIKSLNKLNYFNYRNSINRARFIISHQRKSTSGFTNKYTHPFRENGFVLAHNGIVNDFLNEKEKHSDTYSFFMRFLFEFDLKKDESREKRIINSIKNLLDDKRGLSYSIIIYDELTNKAYYFKNELTDIHLWKNKHFAFITTNGNNDSFFNMLNEKLKEFEIDDYKIYRITFKNVVDISEIGKINNTKATETQNLLNKWENYKGTSYDLDNEVDRAIKEETIENEFYTKEIESSYADLIKKIRDKYTDEELVEYLFKNYYVDSIDNTLKGLTITDLERLDKELSNEKGTEYQADDYC